MVERSTLSAALMLALSATPSGAAETWVEARSPNFTVFTDDGEASARRLAYRLEQVRSAFHQFLPMARTGSPRPIVVYAAKDEASMRRLVTGGAPGPPAGLFIPGSERHRIVLRADAPDEYGERLVNHEYLHSLLRQNDHRLPLWLEEGLAEYYGATVVRDDRITIGMIAPEHLVNLQGLSLMKLEDLLAADIEAYRRHGSHGATVFYAQSWALVHYLTLGDPAHAGRLSELAQLLKDGVPPLEAARRALGDLAVVEKQLAKYVRGLRFPVAYLAVTLSIPDRRTFAVRRLPDTEALAWKAELQAILGRGGDARALLAQALKLDPQNVRAAEVMALVANQEGKSSEALEWSGRAVTGGSESLLAHWLYAEALLERGKSAEPPDTPAAGSGESKRQAEASLVRVTSQHAWFAPAASRLADIYTREDREPERALALARQAVAAEPGAAEHRLVLGHTLYLQGHRAAARAELNRAVALAGESEKARVESYRTWMDEQEKRQPAGSAGYEEACARGDLEKCADLGLRYEKGTGVARDPARALALYRKSCDGGWANGCMVLGVAHVNGVGMAAPDPAQGITLLEKSCALGEAQACVIAGQMLTTTGLRGGEDLPRAQGFFAKACAKGNVDGCVRQARAMVGRGLHAAAAKLLRGACDEGHPLGCTDLGILHSMGWGVVRDEQAARALWTKACDLGHQSACARVGAQTP